MFTLTRAAAAAAAVSAVGLTLSAGLLTGLPAAHAATIRAAAGAASAQDSTWAQSNAQTDLAEIAIGQIAEQRALHSATKSLAQVTMSDHEKALSQLKQVASQTGITLPTTPNATQLAQAAELKSVPASQFDVTYDSAQIKGHELSISQTDAEIADGSSSVVMDYAAVYLKVAKMHLQMAESGYAQLTGSTSGAPSVNAGSGGMAATPSSDDAPWLAAGAAGLVLLAGSGAFGLRRRLVGRS